MPLLATEVPVSRVLWLPEVLRAAGLTVHEVPGWQTRGAGTFGPVVGLTCHETRGSATSTDAGEINVLVNGRPGLSGPISQTYLSRSGAWHVIASGTAHHNKVGWAGPNEGYGNDALIGVEAQHAEDEPWTDVQYRSYVRGVAAIIRHLGISPSRVGGHKEHQPGEKTDPGFDMGQFRRDVAAVLAGEDDDMPTIEEIQRAVELGIHAALGKAASRGDAYGRQVGDSIAKLLAPVYAGHRVLGEAIARESSNPDEVRAALAELPQSQPVDVKQLAPALAAELLPGLTAALPDSGATVTQEALESAVETGLRNVLGSLDTAPQG